MDEEVKASLGVSSAGHAAQLGRAPSAAEPLCKADTQIRQGLMAE